MTEPCKSSVPGRIVYREVYGLGDEFVTLVIAGVERPRSAEEMPCLGCARAVLFTGDGYCPPCREVYRWQA